MVTAPRARNGGASRDYCAETMQDTRVYRADGLWPRIAISGDGQLESTLATIMVGWGLVAAEGEPDRPIAASDLYVEQSVDGWTCSGIALDTPLSYHDPVAASCSLIANVFKAHTIMDDSLLCLHAAGVQVGGGVVLLTGAYRAGKSVVSAACAAAGLRVFSDDIVPLSPDGRTARAAGLAIRLRQPLPGSLAPETLDFLARHQAAASQRYLYVRPSADKLAEFGAEAPVRAVVALDREGSGAARLDLLPVDRALRETILRNFARATPASRILNAFDGLVGDIPCLKLRYNRAEDAAHLLATDLDRTFVDTVGTVAGPSPGQRSRTCQAEPKPVLHPDTMICQASGVQVSERSGELFLIDQQDRTIFNLNTTAAAVWNVASEPTRIGELVAVFVEAFPDRTRREITTDLSNIVHRLTRDGLLTLEAGGKDEAAAQACEKQRGRAPASK